MSHGEYSNQEDRSSTESSDNSASQESSQGSQSQDSYSSSDSFLSFDQFLKKDAEEGKYLYIIRARGTDDYKIGITNYPKDRLKNLQQGNANELILKRVYEGTDARQVESELLQEIEMNEIGNRQMGEWFRVTNREDLYDLADSKTEGNRFDFQVANLPE